MIIKSFRGKKKLIKCIGTIFGIFFWTIPICQIFTYQVLTVTLHLKKSILKIVYLRKKYLKQNDSRFKKKTLLKLSRIFFFKLMICLIWGSKKPSKLKTVLVTKLCLLPKNKQKHNKQTKHDIQYFWKALSVMFFFKFQKKLKPFVSALNSQMV